MTDWVVDKHGNRWRPTGTPPAPPPEREFYEAMYRNARAQLRTPSRLPKALRKYWQHQLWTARACLKSYFGADPPDEREP